MFFSIIIPVFNTEKYLATCIQSVLKQDDKEFEIILINDGSTDHSGELCDMLSEKYSAITVIHKINAGLSAARNDGIHKASGEYLLFLDSDDYWITDHLLSKIRKKIKEEKIDLVGFDCYSLYDDVGIFSKDTQNHFENLSKCNFEMGHLFLQEVLNCNQVFHYYAWAYAVKKQLIIDNNLFFPFGRTYEDVYLMPRLICRAQGVSILQEGCYAYRRSREGAITNIPQLLSLQDMLWAAETNIQEIHEITDDENTARLLCGGFSQLYFTCCIYCFSLEKSNRKKLYDILKEKKWMMKYSVKKKWQVLRILSKVIGLRQMMLLLYVRSYVKSRLRS